MQSPPPLVLNQEWKAEADGLHLRSGTGTTSLAHKDPTDAAQVPPSVLREHVGDPIIEHGDHTHAREARHQSVSHQEAHRGI